MSMTQNSTQTNGQDAVLKPLLDFWSDWIGQSQEQTKVLLEGFREVGDLAALRSLWLESLAKSLDTHMRTPAFLEAMRQHFEVMTHLQSQAEGTASDVARATGVPRIADISGLFERLQIGQEAILARLTGIEHRLEALENRRKHAKES
jgi:hypothetical protein